MPFQFMNAVLREGMRAAVSCQLLEGDRPIDIVWEFGGRPIPSHGSNVGPKIKLYVTSHLASFPHHVGNHDPHSGRVLINPRHRVIVSRPQWSAQMTYFSSRSK